MEMSDAKTLKIRELEVKLVELIQEREDIHKKCDSERDPKQRASYWVKIGTLEDAIYKLRNDIVSQKAS